MKNILFIVTLLVTSAFSADKIKIYFDAGGSPGGSYSSIVVNGAKEAAKDLDIDLRVYYSNWSSSKMINNFKKAISSNIDGIAIMGHPGDAAYELLIKEARANNILVSSLDTALPKMQKKYESSGFGYVGSNNYTAGIALASEAIKRAGLKKGDTAMVWGFLGKADRGLRAKGMIKALEDFGIKVNYIEISNEINKDPFLGSSVFTAYISKHSDTKLILIDHGGLTAQMETFSRIAHIKADDYFIAGYSLSPATIHAIKKSYVDLIGDSQPFLQGYLSVLQLVLTKKYGFSGLNIDTGASFVDKSNISMIESLVKKSIR